MYTVCIKQHSQLTTNNVPLYMKHETISLQFYFSNTILSFKQYTLTVSNAIWTTYFSRIPLNNMQNLYEKYEIHFQSTVYVLYTRPIAQFVPNMIHSQ